MTNVNFTMDEWLIYAAARAVSPVVVDGYRRLGFLEKEIPIVDKYIGLTSAVLGLNWLINARSENPYVAFPPITLICYGVLIKETRDIDLIRKFNNFRERQTIANILELVKELDEYIIKDFCEDFAKKLGKKIPDISEFIYKTIEQLK